MVITTGILGRYFLENAEWACQVVSREQLALFVVNDKIQAFRQNFEFWKTCVHQWELDGISVL